MTHKLLYGNIDGYSLENLRIEGYQFIVISNNYDINDSNIATDGSYLMPSIGLLSLVMSDMIDYDECARQYRDELMANSIPDIALIGHAVSTGRKVAFISSGDENNIIGHLEILSNFIAERYNIQVESIDSYITNQSHSQVHFDDIDRNMIYNDLQINKIAYATAMSEFNSYSTEELKSIIKKNNDIKAIENYFGKHFDKINRLEIIEFLEV